jgi:hypothetical protein
MLTCQANAHYLHTEPESSLSKQMDRLKLKKHVCKIVLWLVGRPETSSQRQHGPFGLDSDQSAGGPYSIEVQQEEFQIGKLVSNIHRMA